ncbi:alpha/beta fold hydrolase [Embleya sp. NBC_00888]|uniref:alpha/beta fold hydrolase n=1 Tax=Embleya sp. NBC_00888 TaxID=2975960 RepID=UPI0038677C2F
MGLPGVHVVGASLGGMVGQTMAIEYGDRIRSSTSMMSSTGARDVGQADFAALGGLGPAPEDRQGHIDWTIRASRVLGSPGFVFDEAAVAERAGRAYDRGHDRSAMLRQAVATVASGDRTARLGSVRVPILVIHGTADIMCDVSGGRATAAAVPGAELVVIDGMGHNFPRELWPRFGALIANLVQHVERNPS